MTETAAAPGTGLSRWLDWCTFAGLLALIFWLPLPIGSRQPWGVALLALAVWGLLSIRFVAAVVSASASPLARLARSGWAVAGFALLALLPLAQVLAPAPGVAGLGTLDAWRTEQFALQASVMLGLFLLTVACVSSQRRAMWVLGTIVLAGVVQAILGVALRAAGGEYLLLFNEFYQGGRVTGTFVNSDHFAGYIELCLSAGVGILIAQFSSLSTPQGQGWQAASRRALDFLLSTKMMVRLALVLMVVALVMTHSRAGNGAFFISLLLVGGVVAWRSKALRKPALWLVGSMAVIDLLIVGQWVGLERLVERMQDTAIATKQDALASVELEDERLALRGLAAAPQREESLQDRLEMPLSAWPLVEQKPVFGHGGGTFRDAMPTAKSADVRLSSFYWDYAHNDYIQTAIELGLVGLALWLFLGVATVWRAARLLSDRQPALARGVGVAGLMALSCLALHSVVDFNLQIAANAATLTVLMAVVWATPATARKTRRSSATQRSSVSDTSGRRPKAPAPA